MKLKDVLKALNPVRQDAKNLLTEFPWFEVHDGIMHTTNGYTLPGIHLEVPSTLFRNSDEDISFFLYELLRHLPEPCQLRHVLYTLPLKGEEVSRYRSRITAPEPGLRALLGERANRFEERARAGELRSWHHALILRLGTPHQERHDDVLIQELTRQANAVRNTVIARFKQIGWTARAMTNADVRDLCFRFMNPGLMDVDLGPYHFNTTIYGTDFIKDNEGARSNTFRAQVLTSTVLNDDLPFIRVGDQYCKMITLKGLPSETYAGILQVVEAANKDFFFVTDYFSDVAEISYHRIAEQNKWYQAAMLTGGYIDRETVNLEKDSTEALDDVKANNDKFLKVSNSLVLFDRDLERLEKKTKEMYRLLVNIPGNPYMVLSLGIWEQFKNATPFSGFESLQQSTMTCRAARDFLPLTGPWLGTSPEKATFTFGNRYAQHTYVNMFEKGAGYNAIGVGATRSGKSFWLQTSVSEFLGNKDMTAIVIDKGSGYRNLVTACEGAYVNVAESSFNPFELTGGRTEPTPEEVTDTVTVLRSMVPGGEGEKLDIETALMTEAVVNSYKYTTRSIGGDTRFSYPTLSTFVRCLRTLNELRGVRLEPYQQDWSHSLATRFSLWTGNTSQARFVDRQTSVRLSGRLIYFDIAGILSDPQLKVPGVLLVQNFVKRYLAAKGGNALVGLDEAFAVIRNSPIGKAFVEDMYRTFAKLGVGIFSLSQSIDDFPDGIRNNAAMFFGFSSPVSEVDKWVEHFQVSEHVRAAALDLRKKEGEFSEGLCIFRRPSGYQGNIIVLEPTTQDHWMFTSEADQVKEAAKVIASHGGVQAALEQSIGAAK
jgi:conjugal transfer ATP-binding protein TraC